MKKSPQGLESGQQELPALFLGKRVWETSLASAFPPFAQPPLLCGFACTDPGADLPLTPGHGREF